MILNTPAVTQKPLFSELSDGADMKIIFQILVPCKYYMNCKI